MSAIPIEQQIACVEREIKFRADTYKKLVESGLMIRETAFREFTEMRAVLETLQLITRRKIAYFLRRDNEEIAQENAKLRDENIRLREQIERDVIAYNRVIAQLKLRLGDEYKDGGIHVEN